MRASPPARNTLRTPPPWAKQQATKRALQARITTSASTSPQDWAMWRRRASSQTSTTPTNMSEGNQPSPAETTPDQTRPQMTNSMEMLSSQWITAVLSETNSLIWHQKRWTVKDSMTIALLRWTRRAIITEKTAAERRRNCKTIISSLPNEFHWIVNTYLVNWKNHFLIRVEERT